MYLTWQNDPTSTILINIHGFNTPANLYIYYDSEAHESKIDEYRFKQVVKQANVIVLPDGRKLYHAELSNLESNREYYFTIGDCCRPLIEEKKFKTIPSTYDELTFIEGGDWENTPNALLLAKIAGSHNPSAIFLGGDYPSGVQSKADYKKWDLWLDNFQQGLVTEEGFLIPMVLAIGNHEVIGGFGRSKEFSPFYFDYFPQKNRSSYFSLDFGEKIKLFVLDSGHTSSHDGLQLSWLKNELEYTQQPIKIALYHVPLYPSIRFYEKKNAFHLVTKLLTRVNKGFKANLLFSYESQQGRRFWLPLFDQHHLTVAFEHHDQTLKRTKLLKNDKENEAGTLYLGDGGWGPLVQYPPIQGFLKSHFAKVIGKVHFFWLVKVSKNSIEYRAIDQNGAVIDHYIQAIK